MEHLEIQTYLSRSILEEAFLREKIERDDGIWEEDLDLSARPSEMEFLELPIIWPTWVLSRRERKTQPRSDRRAG